MIAERPLAAAIGRLRAFLRRGTRRAARSQVLVVVEGPNDVEFLRRISAILHRDDPSLPDLADMERRRELIFAPTGGVDLSTGFRFAGLNLPEFHLLDRDLPPVTQTRYQVAAMVNSRSRCRAAVTSKRSVENYLHSDSIFEVSGIKVAFSDEDDLPGLIARQANQHHESEVAWDGLSVRARKRLRYKTKRWLNTRGVEKMTAARLAERDTSGEVRGWLVTIANLSQQ
ncbi:MAG: ATP-dependent endonuclease [Thermoguttaceae bacterium]